MNHPFVQMLWISIIGCATVVISTSIEEQFYDALKQQRRLSSSGSQVSVMAQIKDRYSGSELQSGETDFDLAVCQGVDQTTRKLYAMAGQPFAHEQQRILSSSGSQLSVMAQIKDRYSGSELQSGETNFDLAVCEDEVMNTLHRNLVEGLSNEQRALRSSGSQVSVMAQIKDRYSGSDLQNDIGETHQLVACSISKADSVMSNYYDVCQIDRCCELEEYVTDFIHKALAFSSYCSLYSDNLNEDGIISVSSDFPGPYLEPGLPEELVEYGVGLQNAMSKCHESCLAGQPWEVKESLLTDLEAVLGQWTDVSKTCAETAVPIIEEVAPPTPLSDEIMASREIKEAQNAFFAETAVRHFEEKFNLAICPAFYDYVFNLFEGGMQMLTYIDLFSDMCDAAAEGNSVFDMPLPEMPSAKGLYKVKQLVNNRLRLCPGDTTSPTSDNMMNLFNQIQDYYGIEMLSLQTNFENIHHSCEAVGINGGQEAPVGAYSHTVNLRHTKTGQGFCGGILFSPTHVLTAAHCQTNAAGEEVRYVSVGGHYSKGHSKGSEKISVKGKALHPDYDAVSKKNDIMILELDHPINPSKNVVIAQLGELPEGFEEMGMPVKMTGWGSDSALTSFSHVMKEHALNLETTTVCDAMLDEDIDDSFICSAGNYGSTVCFGDSGGPLQLIDHHNVAAPPIIVGIVNFGVPCGLGRPDAFARISHFKDWINDVLLDSSKFTEVSKNSKKNKKSKQNKKNKKNEKNKRKLSTANVYNPWVSPSLNEFVEDDSLKLRDGQFFQCQGEPHQDYIFYYGYRHEFRSSIPVTKTVDCSFVPHLQTLLNLVKGEINVQLMHTLQRFEKLLKKNNVEELKSLYNKVKKLNERVKERTIKIKKRKTKRAKNKESKVLKKKLNNLIQKNERLMKKKQRLMDKNMVSIEKVANNKKIIDEIVKSMENNKILMNEIKELMKSMDNEK